MYKYKAIRVNGIKKDVHRHLMEQELGRKLLRTEIVHHINGDKHDNQIENLQLMSWKAHINHHQKTGDMSIINPIKSWASRQRKRDIENNLYQCYGCNQMIPFDGFQKNIRMKFGLQSKCKDCRKTLG